MRVIKPRTPATAPSAEVETSCLLDPALSALELLVTMTVHDDPEVVVVTATGT